MTVEATPQQELEMRRAQHAKQLIEDPILVEAFANLEAVYTDRMRNAHRTRVQEMSPTDVRELYAYRLEAIDAFKEELHHVLTTGKMVEKLLQDQADQEAELEADRRENG